MSDGQTTDTQTSVSQPQPTVAVRPRSRGPSVVQIAVVVAILGAGILVTALTSDVTRVSEPGVRLVDGQPFLPEKVADWTGGELQGLSENERKLLPADTEGARRLYTDKAGDEVFCSIILAGREVTSIHRPELCLPGQGWRIENEYTESIPTAAADGGQLKRDAHEYDPRCEFAGRSRDASPICFCLLVCRKRARDAVPLATDSLDGQGPRAAQHESSVGVRSDLRSRDEGASGKRSRAIGSRDDAVDHAICAGHLSRAGFGLVRMTKRGDEQSARFWVSCQASKESCSSSSTKSATRC